MTGELLLLLVEDHDGLRSATCRFLSQHGYSVVGVACAEDVDDIPLSRTPDLYIIDLNLPGEDGLSLSKRIRRSQPLAGIVITTARTQLNDRLIGYEAGADMYLPKPVEPKELLAALAALSKRMQRESAVGFLTLDKRTHILQGPTGHCKLADSEVRLLVALATAKEQTLERWQVAVRLSPNNDAMSADNLQNRISQLRKKISLCGVTGESLRALRGNGYFLCISLVVT